MLKDLKKALRRRQTRDIAWFLKTGATPPIRKQRTRWFVQAVKRRERVEFDSDSYGRGAAFFDRCMTGDLAGGR